MKKIIALALFCASSLPVAVYAESEGHGENNGESYVGVSVTKLTAAPSSTGAALLLGHRYSEHLAVEIGYENSAALSKAAEKTSALSLAAVGILPLNKDFEVFGRLGYAQARTSNDLGENATHGDITYGVGAEYRLTEKFSLGLGWDCVKTGDNATNIKRATERSYALTLTRSF